MTDDVLVFGASGLLGAVLCPQLQRKGWRVFRQSREEGAEVQCDPADLGSVRAAVKGLRPVAIVNLVAISNVDYCENHLSEAYIANVRTVEILATVAREMESRPHLVQISTDHLYSGTGPHRESTVLPINAYAITKLAGELVALQAGATVMRTSFFGRSHTERRISFTDWLYKSLISGKTFTVFEDVLFSALHMETLAACVARIIETRRAGVFNVGSRNGLSKARFAKLFAEELGLDTSGMKVGSFKDVKLTAPRPQDMRMDVTAFESAFGMNMPDLAKQIRVAADEYRS